MGVCSVFTLLLCGQTTFPWAVAFVSSTMGLATFSHRYWQSRDVFIKVFAPDLIRAFTVLSEN